MEAMATTTGERQRPQARAKRPRSALTSGRKLLLRGDVNSAWSRRYHDVLGGLVSDAGGVEMLSEAQAALCRDAACLEIELERMRGALSEGGEVDLDLYGRVAGQRRRILETLGLERRARDVTPTLSAHLAGKAREKAVDSISSPAATVGPSRAKRVSGLLASLAGVPHDACDHRPRRDRRSQPVRPRGFVTVTRGAPGWCSWLRCLPYR
jgi:hypothetical protein